MPLKVRDVYDQSVRDALRRALKDDRRISHEEVVELIRSTLDGGSISKYEYDDLKTIMGQSATISARSQKLLQTLLVELGQAIGNQPQTNIPEDASNLVCDFLGRTGVGRFPNLDRDEVGIGLLVRLNKPGRIDQGRGSLCGPAALLFSIACDDPTAYARFGVELFEKGGARIGKLKVEPSADCRNYIPPASQIHPVDWMMAASLRDSENWFFDYQDVENEFSGITLPGELADWFEEAGYHDVKNVTNLMLRKERRDLAEVNRLFLAGYRVCLFIGGNMLKARTQGSGTTTADHWVVLRSTIGQTAQGIKLKVFTWGDGDYSVPGPGAGILGEEQFLNNFYGYVAAK